MGLVDDYLAGAGSLAPFYRCHPSELWSAAAPTSPWAAGLADALRQYQEALHAPKEFLGTESVIATGQQPGIFTGPLYSIYKAITAVRLARAYGERHGKSCLPIFWVAGDDHDFEEVRTAHVLTRQFESLSLRYEPADYIESAAMYQVAVESSIHALIDEASNRCAGPFREEVSAWLHGTATESTSVAHWFSLLMARLFKDTPLLVFVPHLEAARRGAAPVIQREIDEPLASTRRSNAAAARLEGLGYPPQVVKGENECNFFLDFGGRRRKVVWDGNAFHIPSESLHVSQEEMRQLLTSHPERFSANVVIRPVVQQALFPVAAYIGGPGELAYWLQLKDVFDGHSQPMPVVYPRAQALLIDTKTKKLREKFGFAEGDWFTSSSELESRALLASIRNPALDALRAQRPALESALDDLAIALEKAQGKDKSVGERARGFSSHTLANLDRLEEALAQSDSQQADTVRTQVRRVCQVVAPNRKPQERYYSVVSWLFEYGWDLVPMLLERLEPEARGVQEIEL